METLLTTTALSTREAIALVKRKRNEIVRELLFDRVLRRYIEDNYSPHAIPMEMLNLIKRDLAEIIISPVNVIQYGTVINETKEAGKLIDCEKNRYFFYAEVNSIIDNYFPALSLY